MNNRIYKLGAMLFCLSFVTTAIAGETVESISKKITGATKKLDSCSAKTKTITKMDQQGFSMTSTMEGTVELLRKGDIFLMRNEMKTVTETSVAGNTTKQEATMLVIFDGTHTYTLSESNGMKNASRQKTEKPNQDPLKSIQESANLKVLPDAKVDGKDTWTIEATPKQTIPGQGKMVISFDKQTGQMLKMIAYTSDGKPMSTMTCTDLKVNKSISADRFVFKAPPGVTVQDM